MMKLSSFFVIGIFAALVGWMILAVGCAQIAFPTGGVRDTIPPILAKAIPPSGTTEFHAKKITLYFNEFVELQDLQKNLFMSPVPSRNPLINSNLRVVTIELKDSLLANTTYSIQLGDAIRDINENNVLKDFRYVFSTGKLIDSLTLGGKVVLAQNGGADSTMLVLLYRDLNDSAVQKKKPDFMARVSGDGSFFFQNLPATTGRIYALKDNDGSRTYNSKKELFAFMDTPISISGHNAPLELLAFQQEPQVSGSSLAVKVLAEKKLKLSTNLMGNFQGLIDPLIISFNNPLKKADLSSLLLTDSNNVSMSFSPLLDGSQRKIYINQKWKAGGFYKLIIPGNFAEDSLGNKLAISDTIDFTVREDSYYGRALFRFPSMDSIKHPVIQLIQGDEVKFSAPLLGKTWKQNLIPPGEYAIRIFFDTNNNANHDTGNFTEKLQPERAITLPQKFSVRADWDNERDISY